MPTVRTYVRRMFPALLLFGTAAGVRPAAAQTVAATTLGPGGSYDPTSQYLVGGSASSFQFIATPFVYTGPTGLLLDQVKLGLNTGSTRTYIVTLLRGSDLLTASTVNTWNLPVTAAFPGYAMLTLSAVGNLPLVSTETYWLAVSGLGPMGGWLFANQGTRREIYVRDLFSADWRSDGVRQATAYEVTVRAGAPTSPSVVPEPATVLLMGTGLLVLGGLQRRTRRPA